MLIPNTERHINKIPTTLPQPFRFPVPSTAMAPSRAVEPTNGLSKPKSTHLSDPLLLPFLAPSFDPTAYLNSTLPPLQLSSRPSISSKPSPYPSNENEPLRPAALVDVSSQTQTLLSHLSAQTTRLSNVLTTLTDDILRSGGRLAYEVEVLSGEVAGLEELLTDGLGGQIEKFVPGGLNVVVPPTPPKSQDREGRRRSSTLSSLKTDTMQSPVKAGQPAKLPEPPEDPEYISHLRTLSLVRSRLEGVTKTFSKAMDWPIPPSSTSIASSFISVSAPEPGSASHSLEEAGQTALRKLREEVAELLDAHDGTEDSRRDAATAARQRVEDLRDLAGLWRGTVEEKARLKFVDSLSKTVEDREKALHNIYGAPDSTAGSYAMAAGDGSGTAAGQRRASVGRPGAAANTSGTLEQKKEETGGFGWSGDMPSGYGLISQLQKMRGGM
jgi:hypothetical protein